MGGVVYYDAEPDREAADTRRTAPSRALLGQWDVNGKESDGMQAAHKGAGPGPVYTRYDPFPQAGFASSVSRAYLGVHTVVQIGEEIVAALDLVKPAFIEVAVADLVV